jgi:hypothetical protein
MNYELIVIDGIFKLIYCYLTSINTIMWLEIGRLKSEEA